MCGGGCHLFWGCSVLARGGFEELRAWFSCSGEGSSILWCGRGLGDRSCIAAGPKGPSLVGRVGVVVLVVLWAWSVADCGMFAATLRFCVHEADDLCLLSYGTVIFVLFGRFIMLQMESVVVVGEIMDGDLDRLRT